MSTGKVPCTVCGVEIQTLTAKRTGGLCMPCSEGGRYVPEDFQEVRRRWERKIVTNHSEPRTHFAERYAAGDRETVWEELHKLDLRRPTSQEVFADIVDCVRLTMRRVRSNIEVLAKALPELGYEFQRPKRVHVPPSQVGLATLAVLEDLYGPLPLTLMIFYEEVGAVDFRQDHESIVPPDELSASESPVLTLGMYDPLFVTSVAHLAKSAKDDLPHLSRKFGSPPGNVRLSCWLAHDEFHKADYGGGADYSVLLPEPSVDFPVMGFNLSDDDPILKNEDQYPIHEDFGPCEFFLRNLRQSFLNAGFRGQSDPEGDGRRLAPDWEPLHRIAAKLLPV